jgi:hypothetical protein
MPPGWLWRLRRHPLPSWRAAGPDLAQRAASGSHAGSSPPPSGPAAPRRPRSRACPGRGSCSRCVRVRADASSMPSRRASRRQGAEVLDRDVVSLSPHWLDACGTKVRADGDDQGAVRRQRGVGMTTVVGGVTHTHQRIGECEMDTLTGEALVGGEGESRLPETTDAVHGHGPRCVDLPSDDDGGNEERQPSHRDGRADLPVSALCPELPCADDLELGGAGLDGSTSLLFGAASVVRTLAMALARWGGSSAVARGGALHHQPLPKHVLGSLRGGGGGGRGRMQEALPVRGKALDRSRSHWRDRRRHLRRRCGGGWLRLAARKQGERAHPRDGLRDHRSCAGHAGISRITGCPSCR